MAELLKTISVLSKEWLGTRVNLCTTANEHLQASCTL